MSALFNENAYPPRPQFAAAYARYVRRGYLHMRNTNVVICGLARNVQAYLPHTAKMIEATGQLFADYRVVIYENDSEDKTLPMLRLWRRHNSRLDVLSERRGDPVNPGTRCMQRVERMAYYREVCRRYLVDTYTSRFEFTLLVDTDLPGGWSLDGLANTIGRPDWDMVGSNGLLTITSNPRKPRVVYFDAFAYREHGRPEPHTAQEVNPKQFFRGEDLRPMYSCFGGLGLYRSECLAHSQYAGGDCEHVPFHLGLRKAGYDKQFLNPSQIVLYGERSW